MKARILVAGIFLLFSACTDPGQDSDVASDIPRPQMLFVTNTPDLKTPQERSEYGRQLSQLAEPVYTLTVASSLNEAQRRASAIINSQPNDMGRAAAEQLASQALLSTWMQSDEASPAFIASQVEPLLAHQTPTPALIADALDQLRGFWSSDQIAQAAEQAATATIDALRKESKCEACSRKQIEERILGSEGRSGRMLELQEGLKRLDRMTS